MTHPYPIPEPQLLIGPSEPTVADVRAALDALNVAALAPDTAYTQVAGLIDAAPDATLTRTILLLDLNTDDTAGAPSYAARNSADGTLLSGLTLDPATLADLESPPQVTVIIEPGDRLNAAPQDNYGHAAPALTDVLLAEQNATRAAVAYAATDPDADPTTRMQTALAEAADVLGQARNETDQ
jgi:hypothetical protein